MFCMELQTNERIASELALEPSLEHRSLKLLSYNIQVGIPTQKYRHYVTKSWKHMLPFSGRQENLQKIAHFIKDFDIVGLLELDAGSIRTKFVHQPSYVAEQSGFPYVYTKTNRDIGVFAKHSFAILSRHKACKVIEHSLPSKIPGRGALELHFGSSKDPLVVVLAHLSLLPGGRRKQLDYLSNLIKDRRHAVLMGDFNAQTHGAEFESFFSNTTMNRPKTAQHTFPSWKPRLSYDHILVTPDVHKKESEVYGVNYSDHLPVGMEVDVPSGAFA